MVRELLRGEGGVGLCGAAIAALDQCQASIDRVEVTSGRGVATANCTTTTTASPSLPPPSSSSDLGNRPLCFACTVRTAHTAAKSRAFARVMLLASPSLSCCRVPSLGFARRQTRLLLGDHQPAAFAHASSSAPRTASTRVSPRGPSTSAFHSRASRHRSTSSQPRSDRYVLHQVTELNPCRDCRLPPRSPPLVFRVRSCPEGLRRLAGMSSC